MSASTIWFSEYMRNKSVSIVFSFARPQIMVFMAILPSLCENHNCFYPVCALPSRPIGTLKFRYG